MWGVFATMQPDVGLMEVHTVPCHEDGTLRLPHVLSPYCTCHPEIDEESDVVLHNEIN